MATRKANENTFPNWEDLPDGGRRYWIDDERADGTLMRYLKVVDANERTLSFIQEVYDSRGELIGIHEKFPVDKGHRRV